jgi:hypothetical protein
VYQRHNSWTLCCRIAKLTRNVPLTPRLRKHGVISPLFLKYLALFLGPGTSDACLCAIYLNWALILTDELKLRGLVSRILMNGSCFAFDKNLVKASEERRMMKSFTLVLLARYTIPHNTGTESREQIRSTCNMHG